MDNNFSNNGYQNQNNDRGQDTYGSQNAYANQNAASGQDAYSSQNAASGQNVYGSQNAASSQNVYGGQDAAGSQNAYSNQNTASSQNAYGNQNAASSQNAYSNQNTASAQNVYSSQQAHNSAGMGYNPYQQPAGTTRAPKKPRRKSGFGVTLGKCAALAVVFGLVAGGVFTGVSYAGTNLLGITSNKDAAADKSSESGSGHGAESDSILQTATGLATDLTDVSSIVDEVMPSIVAITNTGTVTYQTFWGAQQYESQSAGSGVIIRQDEEYLYIVTNNHVVAGADSLTVQFSDNTTVSCEVRGTDAADDLAVVRVAIDSIEKETLDSIRVISIGESESLKVGNAAIAIGNALGYGQSVTCGYISALGRTVSVQDASTGETTVYNNMIQTDASINPGNSGGALLDASGKLVGINSVKYTDTDVEGFGYAIPISDAMPIIEQLITREKVDESQSAYLGIQGQDISSDISQAYNMPEGIYVYQVIKGSAAEKAGLRQGDIITAFDGQTVMSMSELKELLTYYESGQKVTLTIHRLGEGYEEQEVEVKLGSIKEADTGR